jgi:17beta-estradiol 17-dehydrogenase / very-long-chain 3-oxoacyl-CoA reductase
MSNIPALFTTLQSDDPQLYNDTYGSMLGVAVFWASRAFKLVDSAPTRFLAWAVGSAVIVYNIRRGALLFWSFIQPSKLNIYCHSETGSWALVTGSSDGIGKGFAEELLDAGFNVLLHGRNKEKLERVKKELQQQFPRRTIDYVIADAASLNHPENAVVEKVKQLPGKLTILVNNVGGNPYKPIFQSVRDLPSDIMDNLINLNARFPSQVTRALLPVLQGNQPGLIVNCGSAGGLFGCPYIATYTATKAYIHAFTGALKMEMLGDGLQPVMKPNPAGIEVMGFIIGNTLSNTNTASMPYFTEDARNCAKGVLAKVGNGKTLQYPTWRHALQISIMSNLPMSMIEPSFVEEMRKRKLGEEKEQ